MLLAIAAVLIALWIIGLAAHIGGGFVYILVVLALASVIYHFMRGSHHHTTV